MEKKGVEQVKLDLGCGIYGNGRKKKQIAKAWVEKKEEKKQRAHKEVGLGESKKANKLAEKQNLISRRNLYATLIILIVLILVAIFK